jgi:hypothetical protein
MLDKIENRKQISKLRDFMISQLKNSSWEESGWYGFKNEYFTYYYDRDINGWKFEVKYKYDTSARYFVYDIINPLYFWYLKKFFVGPAIRNSDKLKKEAEMAKISKNFFEKNKDIDRDSKLEKILK